MKRRPSILLYAMVVFSLLVAGYALWQANAHHNLTVDRTLFPDLAKQMGDVSRIEISGDGKTTTLLRTGKAWLPAAKG